MVEHLCVFECSIAGEEHALSPSLLSSLCSTTFSPGEINRDREGLLHVYSQVVAHKMKVKTKGMVPDSFMTGNVIYNLSHWV